MIFQKYQYSFTRNHFTDNRLPVFYFQSREEKNNKMAEIKNGDYLIVTTESIDKNGKMTTGKSGRIIFCHKI